MMKQNIIHTRVKWFIQEKSKNSSFNPTDKGVPKRLKDTCHDKISRVTDVNEGVYICDKE